MGSQALAVELYVAPNGNDGNPGTADQPFASLEAARDAARRQPGSTVTLGAGVYRLSRTFELDARDSQTRYRAVPGTVRICGSVAVPSALVKPVTDPAMRSRLAPVVSIQVREIDLGQLGIREFGDIGPRGFRRPYIPAPVELIVADAPLDLARWPNAGQPGEPITAIIDKGSVTRDGEKPLRGGEFTFATDRPAGWSAANEVWITGLFANGYADSTVRVKSFDMAKHALSTVQPHMYGFKTGKPWNRWTALNIIEEIDVPGEYVADKESGKLYFLPPKGCNLASSSLEVTVLREPLVAIEGATGVVFEGIIFENTRGMGLYLERGAGNRIEGCTIRNIGMVGICVGKGIAPDPDYQHQFTGTPVSRALGSWHEHIYENTAFNREAGTGIGIVGCHLYNIGTGAISLGGGDRKTLQPAGNFVEDCDIHDFNRWDRTYKGAVNIDGVGNRISHCRLHEAAALAIYIHGNDHLIEYNEVYNAMIDGDDMGAIYMGRDPSEAGNVLRHNFIHHIGNDVADQWRNGLYLDDQSCGMFAEGNIFFHCVYNVAINGGYHRFENNILMASQHKGNRGIPAGKPSQKWYEWTRTAAIQKRLLKDVDITAPPYSERYPELKALYEAPPDAVRASRIYNNVYVWPDGMVGDNPGNDNRNNIHVSEDPGFVDAVAMDFRLRPDSVIFARNPDFKPIPFEKIGPLRPVIGARSP